MVELPAGPSLTVLRQNASGGAAEVAALRGAHVPVLWRDADVVAVPDSPSASEPPQT